MTLRGISLTHVALLQDAITWLRPGFTSRSIVDDVPTDDCGGSYSFDDLLTALTERLGNPFAPLLLRGDFKNRCPGTPPRVEAGGDVAFSVLDGFAANDANSVNLVLEYSRDECQHD